MKLNPDLFAFVLLALAIYRVARMVGVERGPFDLFQNLRGWAARKYKPLPGQGRHWIDEGLGCPMCISFWLGFAGAWVLSPAGLVEYVVIALALAAVVTVVYRLVG